MWLQLLWIVVGFVFLIGGANYLVDGASGLAKRYHVPDLVIGLTVVAFGTSAPEMVVNIVAAVRGATDIALTNIIGSNIINVLVILGWAAALYPIPSPRSSRMFDIPLSALAGFMLIFLSLGPDAEIGRWDGVILLLVFAVFMYVTVRRGLDGTDTPENFKPVKVWLALLMIVGGLVALVFGGQLIVNASTELATELGVPQSVIGLTIVALGTSLPELATSVVAAYKKNTDMALGNVIGSNIFNVFFVLGISAVIHPLPVYANMWQDALLAGGSCLLVLLFVSTNKKHRILRSEGMLMVLAYVLYIILRL